MNSETKQCKKCQKEFKITTDDQIFYKKMDVPEPTHCPDCRFQRRMSWRNAWHLFKKKDARTGKYVLSLYPEESPVTIYDRDFWYTDGWDQMQYGRDYYFSKPFFKQMAELFYSVPLPSHSMINVSNCRFCTNANNIKNCYLVRASTYSEDSSYLIWDHGSKRCMDSHMTTQCELGYGNVNTEKCYKSFYSVDCENCSDILFSKDCVGCNYCVGCVGLRNKSYCIFNEQYSKEEYALEV